MTGPGAKRSTGSLFPRRLFWVYFGVLLLMSGIHTGLVVLSTDQQWPILLQIIVPLVYWGIVASGLTIFTRRMMQKTYENPMLLLAEASAKVASGDFSVYLPTVHTQDRYDYLDYMFLDFNRMVEELGSMETLKTDFFSNVSHEMKTPLAVISSNAELLSRPGLDPEKQEECLNAILGASRRMNSLITNMLKLNKLEKQTIRPAPQVYDLGEQLVECVFQFEELLDQKELELETELEERILVRQDPELMELVWNNLLSNAVKFTPQGGSITLRMHAQGSSVAVVVGDTGCGMDEETKAHIFEKFYQGDISHATAGNGLGLALVRRILELAEGSISVESAVGTGSSFRVTLPIKQEAPEDEA